MLDIKLLTQSVGNRPIENECTPACLPDPPLNNWFSAINLNNIKHEIAHVKKRLYNDTIPKTKESLMA